MLLTPNLTSVLSVLKSTGSAFEGFVRDEHTTLVEVNDRIFSTSVDLSYTFPTISLEKDGFGALESAMKYDEVHQSAKKITLETFATDESASVQESATSQMRFID